MVSLRSSDGEIFEVEEMVALESGTIKHMVEDNCANGVIPVPNVTGPILAKVIEYCEKHAEDGSATKTERAGDGDLKNWDADFVKVDDHRILIGLAMAANFLDIKGLLDLSCQSLADTIKDKTPEEIRTIFNVTNDFTPEEEEEVRRENLWAFQ